MSILRKLSLTLLATSALGLCLSCGGDEKKTDTTTNNADNVVKDVNEAVEKAPVVDLAPGKKVYETLCLACHGATGKGDGIAATALDPKPRDMSDSAWQSSVDDAYIMKVFLEGGKAVDKDPTMAAFGAAIPDDGSRESLVAYIRSLGK